MTHPLVLTTVYPTPLTLVSTHFKISPCFHYKVHFKQDSISYPSIYLSLHNVTPPSTKIPFTEVVDFCLPFLRNLFKNVCHNGNAKETGLICIPRKKHHMFNCISFMPFRAMKKFEEGIPASRNVPSQKRTQSQIGAITVSFRSFLCNLQNAEGSQALFGVFKES